MPYNGFMVPQCDEIDSMGTLTVRLEAGMNRATMDLWAAGLIGLSTMPAPSKPDPLVKYIEASLLALVNR